MYGVWCMVYDVYFTCSKNRAETLFHYSTVDKKGEKQRSWDGAFGGDVIF